MAPRAPRFLTAEWRHLLMINYACAPELLQPLVPAGTELDSFAGQTVVSLVGFMFLDTRVLGIPIPFHRHFEEVNLRFYVRRRAPDGTWRRGVVFVREIVPRRAIAALANALYNENYVAAPMDHSLPLDPDGTGLRTGEVIYGWGRGPLRCAIHGTVTGAAVPLVENSETEFITEHFWGYTRQRDGGTMEYEVEHPRWRIHPIAAAGITGPLAPVYGQAFARVLAAAPLSAFLAEGSAITVRRGVRLP